ncbi:MAG: acyltransferase [Flavobacteriales bacterium]|nr:acyltransferase [Flavobacteriales bacterium]
MKYNYLEVFRGFMALWVVLFHGFAFLPILPKNIVLKFLNNGFLPVAAFVFLSGFVTYILLEKKESYLFYIKRRAYRLFPIYIVALIISVLMLGLSFDVLNNLPFDNPKIQMRLRLISEAENNFFLNIVSHLGLVHGLFPNERFPFTYTLMGQSWSLTLEWQFYIFIPVIYKAYTSRKVIYVALSLLMIPAMIWSFFYMPQKSFLPNMIHYFLIGFFSYPLFKVYLKEGKYYLFYFLIISALLFSFYNIGVAVMILLFASILALQKIRPRFAELFFNNKHLLNLGKISYSIYCIHMIVYYLVGWVLVKIKINDVFLFSLLFIALGSVITILLSNFTYTYIENKFIKLGKKTS